MSPDHRDLRLPFSEPPVDHPAQPDGRPLPVAEQAFFQQPPGEEPEVPAQTRGRATGPAGSLAFSTPERQG